MPAALLVIQAFPPLLKNAGGVAKRYLTLCRALIDELGWTVTILTPVNVTVSGEPDVDRWIASGSLRHLPARGVRLNSVDGVIVVLDSFSFVNTGYLLGKLCLDQEKLRNEGYVSLNFSSFDLMFIDDLPFRFSLLLLARAAGVPTVMTSHTDGAKLKSYTAYPALKLIWQVHVRSAHLASVHASVSRVFGEQMKHDYGVPVGAIWPPILWAKDFKAEPAAVAERAAGLRKQWLALLQDQGMGKTPTAILLYAGRWSAEKRIDLLLDVVPDGAALVIVGDGTSPEYTSEIAAAGETRPHVLPLRKMLNGHELRTAYAAADLFVSASNFETLGNTLIEAWCSGTPCAVQPEQGHLEFVRDGVNSWFCDYDDPEQAKATLTRIVDGGLSPAKLGKVLPELEPTGRRFRTSNFAREFDAAVVQPARAVRAAQLARGALVEGVIRLLAFLLWLLSWILLRVINRLIYAFSKNPTFEILGKLGSAVETKTPKKPGRVMNMVRRVVPGLRRRPSDSGQPPEATPPPLVQNPSPSEISDYVSHFRDVKGNAWVDKIPGVRRRREARVTRINESRMDARRAASAPHARS